MSSNLKVNTILPSAGTAIGIGTAGGSVSITSDTITSDGKVGLGTTGSDYALSIREADNNNKFLMLQKNSGQEILQIREDGNHHIIIDGSHASGELHFYTAGSERLRITSDGKVGIGTDNPLDSLHISNASPGILITDTDQASNTKNWSITAAVSQVLRIQAQDDSNAGGGNIFDFYKVTNQVNEFRGLQSGNTWFVVDNLNKKVGIKTAVPQVTLDTGGVSAVGISSLQNPTLYAGLPQANANGWSGVVLCAGLNGNAPTVASAKNASGTALPLIFQTDATTRMTISASGTVTKPQQPYVRITGLTNQTGSGNATDGTATTQGSISYSAGRVTAQVEGDYLITFASISDNGTGRIDGRIRVNGNNIVQLLTSDNGTGYRQKSASIVYHLNVNDYVEWNNADWYSASNTTTNWKTASVYLLG